MFPPSQHWDWDAKKTISNNVLHTAPMSPGTYPDQRSPFYRILDDLQNKGRSSRSRRACYLLEEQPQTLFINIQAEQPVTRHHLINLTTSLQLNSFYPT